MKVVFVTTGKPGDIRAWSGTEFFVRKALIDQGVEVVDIGNLSANRSPIDMLLFLFYKIFGGKKYMATRSPTVLRGYARQIERKLKGISCDAVLTTSTIPITYLSHLNTPVFVWVDALFDGMVDYYFSANDYVPFSLKQASQMEKQALERCSRLILASDWAARHARDFYHMPSEKVVVLPFGANIESPPDKDKVDANIAARNLDKLRFLFVGKEWDRKGGDIAVAVVGELNRRGVGAELHVVGCHPPSDVPVYVHCHGFLGKQDPQQYLELMRLYQQSHFFMVPSRAECFGVVFAEASAYGLPSVTTNTGGIPSVVTNNVNGFAFGPENTVSDYCDWIEHLVSDEAKYKDLCYKARKEFDERLNWNVIGRRLLEIMQAGIAADEPRG